MPRWRNLNDAAKQLGISRRTLTRWSCTGLIKTYKVLGDRKVYVDLDQIKQARREHRPREPKEQ